MLRTPILALALAVLAAPAIAADPENGKITEDQRTTEWSGGPFLVPNPYPTVPLECEEGTPICDVFRFEADLPNANPEDDLITVTLGWETSEMDFDLYVFDETTGEQVGSGTAGAGTSDAATIPAISGKYKVVVYPWAATAEVYTGIVKYEPFEEGKNSVLGFGGALGAGTLLLLAGFGALTRRKASVR